MDFWKVHFGQDEARGDKYLPNYFVPIPEFEDIIAGKYRYVIGRKGTGKSAIIERIKLRAMEQPNWFEKVLSLKDFPLPLLRQMRDTTMRDKSQFVPIWTFLILVELADLTLKDHSAGPAEVTRAISEFLAANFPNGISFSETLRTLSESKQTVSILPAWVGGNSQSSNAYESHGAVHFQKAANMLMGLLCQIQTSSTYFLFVDDLDEGFRNSDGYLRLLILALLRAVENTSLELAHAGVAFRPIVALRQDIFDKLEDNDLNKLDDALVRLTWLSRSNDHHSLRDIVNARLISSFPTAPTDAWTEFAVDDVPADAGGPDLWAYIMRRTLYRPRDVVKFLKLAQKCPVRERLDYETMHTAERAYSEWFCRELRDEIQSHLPVWERAFHAISRLGRARFPAQHLVRELEEDRGIQSWMADAKESAFGIVELLFEFSVLGVTSKKDGKDVFRYVQTSAFIRTGDQVVLHPGLRYHLLRVKRQQDL